MSRGSYFKSLNLVLKRKGHREVKWSSCEAEVIIIYRFVEKAVFIISRIMHNLCIDEDVYCDFFFLNDNFCQFLKNIF